MTKLFFFFSRPPERVYFRAHERAIRVKSLLPRDIFDEFLKFAFVRNPYSWLASLYEARRRGPSHRHHKIVAGMKNFSEYIDWEISKANRYQYRQLADKKENLLVDFLGRYERLTEDHQRICRLFGVQASELPHLNPASKKDYRQYYDHETKEKVARHWARDFEIFGYNFDGLVVDNYALPSSSG